MHVAEVELVCKVDVYLLLKRAILHQSFDPLVKSSNSVTFVTSTIASVKNADSLHFGLKRASAIWGELNMTVWNKVPHLLKLSYMKPYLLLTITFSFSQKGRI